MPGYAVVAARRQPAARRATHLPLPSRVGGARASLQPEEGLHLHEISVDLPRVGGLPLPQPCRYPAAAAAARKGSGNVLLSGVHSLVQGAAAEAAAECGRLRKRTSQRLSSPYPSLSPPLAMGTAMPTQAAVDSS